MFVGHLALALASKRAQPTISLGWFIAAVTMADLIWPVLLIAGVEHVRIAPGATSFTPLAFDSYPWSHSLLMLAVWGLALAAVARWRAKITPTQAWLLVLLVISHWVLDWITHAPDMPFWPGSSPRVGLGLWNSIGGTLAIEGALWLAGLTFYLRGRRATGPMGLVAFWSFVVISTAMWVSGPWSPPPSAPALAWLALVGWIMPAWAAWADRRFRAVSSPAIAN